MVAEKIKIGIHQPNFIPWLPFFHKMAKCDVFVLLTHIQFEKNNFQNRYHLSTGKWVTKPVRSGTEEIFTKNYVGHAGSSEPATGRGSLVDINSRWIRLLAETLRIKTNIVDDDPGHKERSTHKTQRLIDIIHLYTCDTKAIPVYVTNPSAKKKYLDEEMMRSQGIEIEYCKTPNDMNIHTFEAFEKWGIEGTIKQLRR